MKKIFVSLMLVVLLLPVMVGAQIGEPNVTINGDPQNVFDTINRVIDWLFWGLMVAAIFVVIWAAFTFVTAAGDPEKVAKARNLILYAIVAIVVAFLAEAIVFLVSEMVLRAT